ncbi:unnamed protein product [Cuscuta epithymum]|uniref:Reverse transcriptase domain-containing protein n=1 Tax=Cuscuta epithymum TaxID=186058 RepID=A0AAV0FW48_9ASTE|nr:unnamed protein product [Cuscuta epithymum]
MDQDREVPLILGRPFLATARALIDVGDGKLVLRVGDETATFDMSKIMKRPCQDSGECFYLDDIDSMVEDCTPNMLSNEALSDLLFEDSVAAEDLEPLPSFDCLMISGEEDSTDASSVQGTEDDLDKVEKKNFQPDSFFVSPSPLNLKSLPSHLKYTFLDDSPDPPIFLASGLELSQKSACLNLRSEQREALDRKISDTNGISPFFDPFFAKGPDKGPDPFFCFTGDPEMRICFHEFKVLRHLRAFVDRSFDLWKTNSLRGSIFD